MSKKNNQGTRRNLHAARLQKEKEEEQKRAVQQARKQERLADAAVKGVAAPKRLKRKQKKGVRIRKHMVVRGIKVTDAETKKKVKEVLAAEEAMRDLMMDMDGPAAAEQQQDQQAEEGQRQRRVGVGGGARVKGSGVQVKAKAGSGKAAKKGKGKAAGMAVD